MFGHNTDSGGTVTLTASADGAETFEAEFRAQGTEEWSSAGSGTGTQIMHSPGTGAWDYRVRGVNAAGAGPWSEVSTVTVSIA